MAIDESERRGGSTFLVERYWPGVTADALAAAIRRGQRAARAMARQGKPVRYLRSTLVPKDEAVFCMFQAWSSQDVAELNERAWIPFDRIVEAVTLTTDARDAAEVLVL